MPDKIAIERRRDALLQEHPWLDLAHLHSVVAWRITDLNSSATTRRRHLIKLIDQVGAALAPYTPCGKGCSQCCHIALTISSAEAAAITEHTGRPAAKPEMMDPALIKQVQAEYRGHRCPFLVDNLCSIYDVRPFACRSHHTLNSSPAECDLGVPSEESMVSAYNLSDLDLVYVALFATGGSVLADIRLFFPEVKP